MGKIKEKIYFPKEEFEKHMKDFRDWMNDGTVRVRYNPENQCLFFTRWEGNEYGAWHEKEMLQGEIIYLCPECGDRIEKPDDDGSIYCKSCDNCWIPKEGD